MDKPVTERRSTPRIPYHAHAYVFCHNRKHICQIINMSCQGALLTPPIHAKLGTFIRLNLKLPQLDELIDLDAVVIRDAMVGKTHAWGVSFINISSRAEVLMQTFVDWVLAQNEERPVTGKHAVMTDGKKEDDLSRWVDSLDLERLFRDALGGMDRPGKQRKAQ